MKPYNGYKAEKPASAREHLPAGGYVAKILNAEELEYSWGRVLLISFDIADGERKGFFKADYDGNTNEDRKWRGTYRLRVPNGDGSEKDDWSKRAFGNAMWAIEDANPGYHWDWDERGLAGKTVGVLFRNREWEMDGKTGWTTECCKLISADDARTGNYKMPKDKPLDKSAPDSFTQLPDPASDADKLPWEL